jgi:hypothetical protein
MSQATWANIPPVNRLRAHSRDYLLPLLISALVLRALIPAGFMPGGMALTLTAQLCNAPATGNAGTESIEVPGAGTGAMQCDYCLVPLMAGAQALPTIQPSPAIAFRFQPAPDDAPASRFALQRAQIPRAPPLV